VGRARQGGGDGWASHSIAQVRIRARGAATEKKLENRAIAARFQSAYGLQELEGNSVVLQSPLLR
jgi:hypothetical protein